MTRYKFLSIAASLTLLIVTGIATLAGQQRGAAPAGQAAAAPPARQAGHGTGKLVIWGDLSLFEPRGHPESCLLMNRFKRGQPAGFRMTAIDGGTGEVENTAVLVVHVTYGGRIVDAPMRFRGAAGPAAPPPPGYLSAPVELWTGKWVVPSDAPIGAVAYTVTATDAFGRTATFKPFSYSTSQLTVVE
jgi:hypothetical protein